MVKWCGEVVWCGVVVWWCGVVKWYGEVVWWWLRGGGAGMSSNDCECVAIFLVVWLCGGGGFCMVACCC